MKKNASKELRDLAGQAIVRAGGNFNQALRSLSKLVEKTKALRDRAKYLGVLQSLRDAQNVMRTSATVEQLSDFLGKASGSDPVPAISPSDAEKLVGKFLYPLHKSGTFIGLATESAILESIAEIDRNLDGLLSAKRFQNAVLYELKQKRRNKNQRPIDVMSEADIEAIFNEHKKAA